MRLCVIIRHCDCGVEVHGARSPYGHVGPSFDAQDTHNNENDPKNRETKSGIWIDFGSMHLATKFFMTVIWFP